MVSQVCVEACPTKTEIGVRSNPVCVDGVNTSQFDVLKDASADSVAGAQGVAAAVSECRSDSKISGVKPNQTNPPSLPPCRH